MTEMHTQKKRLPVLAYLVLLALLLELASLLDGLLCANWTQSIQGTLVKHRDHQSAAPHCRTPLTLLEVGERLDFGHDETLLEVRVDDASSLRCQTALADSPAAHFVLAGREEVDQAERMVAHLEHAVEDRLVRRVLLLVVGELSSGLEVEHFEFELAADRDDLLVAAALLDELGDLGQVLVALAQVVALAHVNEVYDGLGRQQLHRVENLDLEGAPVAERHVLALLEPRLHAHERLVLHLLLLSAEAALDVLLHALGGLAHALNVLETQLLLDDLDVAHRVDVALDVRHLGRVKAAHHVVDGVHGLDVRQERVAEAGAVGGAAHQAGDVGDGHDGRDPVVRQEADR